MSTVKTSVWVISRSQSCTPMTAWTLRSLTETRSTPVPLGDVGFGAVLADHRPARDGPAGHAVGHVDRGQAAAGQRLGRVRRPAAGAADHVDLAVTRQLSRARAELAEPYVHRVGRVSGHPLVIFAHVQQERPGG